MPQTVNGIGTGYSGKRNITTRRDECASCGQHGDLKSYDTGLYFVVFFIPLIPLGKRRVMDQCPHCGAHRVANLAKWEASKREEVERALAGLEEDPDDPHSAIEAIGVLVSFQEFHAFERVAPSILESTHDNREVVLALASAYDAFEKPKEAEALYRRALEMEDSEDVRESLAINLMHQFRPAEAKPLIDHAIQGSDPSKVGLLWLMMEAYQAEGQHEEALEMLEKCAERMPDLRSDKAFLNAEKVSKKNLQTGRKIRSERLGYASQSHSTGRKGGVLAARLVGPIILAAIVGIYLFFCFQKAYHREVWVVNGLQRPYQVELNGNKLGLPSNRAVKTEVHEGDISIHVLDKDLSIPDQTVQIKTPFLTRPLQDRVFVINPDQVALIIHEEHIFVSESRKVSRDRISQPVYEVYVNAPLHQFRSIEYPFEMVPQEVTMPHKGIERRDDLHVENELPDSTKLLGIEGMLGIETAITTARKRLAIDSDDDVALHYLTQHLEPSEALAFLQAGVDDRPVRIEWHRMYQETLEKSQPERDLTAEYKKLLEKEPDSRALAYLTGRTLLDPDEAEPYFLRAVKDPNPCDFGYLALAYHREACGEFAEGLDYINKAIEINPDKEQYEAIRVRCWLGLGEYGKVLEWVGKRRKQSPSATRLLEYEILAHAANNDIPGAEKAIDQFLSRHQTLAPATPKEVLDEARAYFMAIVEYGKGNTGPAFDLWVEEPTGERGVIALLARDRIDDAAKLLDEEELHDVESDLLTYLAAQRAGKTELADEFLEKGLEGLRGKGSERRYVADTLTGKQPVDPDFLRRLAIESEEKTILLAVLGTKFPEHREVFFSMAKTLNCDLTPPRRLLDSILNGAR